MAQKNDYKRCYWYSEVKNILIEFELNMLDEELKRTPEVMVKKLVEIKKNYFCCLKIFEIEAK